MPSSASKSTLVGAVVGSIIGSSGPITAVGGLKKTSGNLAVERSISAACPLYVRARQMIFRGSTGAFRTISWIGYTTSPIPNSLAVLVEKIADSVDVLIRSCTSLSREMRKFIVEEHTISAFLKLSTSVTIFMILNLYAVKAATKSTTLAPFCNPNLE